jgi:AraC family ethanolamine operon transcriptional activator
VDSILPANMELALFRIEKKSFQDCLEALDRPDIDYRLLANNYLFLPETITTVKCYLNRIFRSVEKSPHILKQPLLEKLILEDFVPLLINSIPYPLNETSLQLSPSFRAKLFQEARDFMIANLDQPKRGQVSING